jgi:hypothetical protein
MMRVRTFDGAPGNANVYKVNVQSTPSTNKSMLGSVGSFVGNRALHLGTTAAEALIIYNLLNWYQLEQERRAGNLP